MNDNLWLRAQSIASLGAMKMNTSQELDIEYEIKGLLKKNKESFETECLLKKQLINLYQDRKSYIEIMDALYDLVSNSHPENPLYNEIKSILRKDNDQFKLDSIRPGFK